MLLIPCPWCGPRCETEFRCDGEAKGPRPDDPNTLTEDAWVDYLCASDNRRGTVAEAWWHEKGCGLWFTLNRDTVSHEIQLPSEGGAP